MADSFVADSFVPDVSARDSFTPDAVDSFSPDAPSGIIKRAPDSFTPDPVSSPSLIDQTILGGKGYGLPQLILLPKQSRRLSAERTSPYPTPKQQTNSLQSKVLTRSRRRSRRKRPIRKYSALRLEH
jgi:hypothetical protein